MKSCEKCGTQIDEKYKYCMGCSNAYKSQHGAPVSAPVVIPSVKQWHDDPVVDALLKLNANVGKMTQVLESINRKLEKE